MKYIRFNGFVQTALCYNEFAGMLFYGMNNKLTIGVCRADRITLACFFFRPSLCISLVGCGVGLRILCRDAVSSCILIDETHIVSLPSQRHHTVDESVPFLIVV